MKKQNRDKESVADDDLIFDDESKDLIEAMLEENQGHMDQDHDPFESYVQRVSTKMQKDPQLFRTRFVKGYQALLEEIKRS